MKELKRFLIAGIIVLAGVFSACTKPAEPKTDVSQESDQMKDTEKKDADMKDEDMKDEDHDDHDDHDHDHEEVDPEDVSLEMWAGDWNSINAYYDDPVVVEAIEEAAKEENITPEEFIKNIEERRSTDYKSLHIDADSITFYDGKMGEGKEMAKANYKLAEILEVPHGSKTLNWFVFETDSKDVKKYMALMQIHGEEHLAHYHTRYADTIDEIKEEGKWFPTYVRTSASSEDVAEELTE